MLTLCFYLLCMTYLCVNVYIYTHSKKKWIGGGISLFLLYSIIIDMIVWFQMWDRLTTGSNRYAAQQRTANPPPPSAAWWADFMDSGFKAFIGICFSMGILKLPRRHHYWRTTKWLYKTNFPSIMSRNRFDLMWRYVHLQDNAVPAPAGEKVWKLRWYVDFLTTRF